MLPALPGPVTDLTGKRVEVMEHPGLYPAAARHGSIDAYGIGRRLIDIVVASVLLVLLAPVLLMTALAVWLDSGLPIIYRYERLGRGGDPITVLKFRTMRDGSHHHLQDLLSADEARAVEYRINRKLRNDPRRTRIGAFLRRASLDELPQLINVVTGQMSLIGPRPYFAHELSGRPEAAEILTVRPGITGLWQVSGRSDRTFEERVTFDLEYSRNRGLDLDARIILGTIAAVVSGRGAY